MSVFRSAITGADGSVDPGYLALFWAMVGWSVSTVVLLGSGAMAVWFKSGEPGTVIQNTGTALGAVSVGFATVIGAVGAFRMGDKPRIPEHGGGTVNVTATA